MQVAIKYYMNGKMKQIWFLVKTFYKCENISDRGDFQIDCYRNSMAFSKEFKTNKSSECIFICLKEFRAYYVIPPGVCPSFRPLAIWFPEDNLSSIWPTVFKLHRMIAIFGRRPLLILGSQGQSHYYLKTENSFQSIT
jgi:hypothetical protein